MMQTHTQIKILALLLLLSNSFSVSANPITTFEDAKKEEQARAAKQDQQLKALWKEALLHSTEIQKLAEEARKSAPDLDIESIEQTKLATASLDQRAVLSQMLPSVSQWSLTEPALEPDYPGPDGRVTPFKRPISSNSPTLLSQGVRTNYSDALEFYNRSLALSSATPQTRLESALKREASQLVRHFQSYLVASESLSVIRMDIRRCPASSNYVRDLKLREKFLLNMMRQNRTVLVDIAGADAVDHLDKEYSFENDTEAK